VAEIFRFVEVERLHSGVVLSFLRPRILEASEIHELSGELQLIVRQYHPEFVLLDMHNVVFLPSTVISLLITFQNRLARVGRKLGLCSLRSEIAEILRIAALDRWFAIYPDKAEALMAITGSAEDPTTREGHERI
jgi:anti-anti-sigma factor